MMKELNLAHAERRVFHSFWQDGLLDLLAGSSVVLIGVGWLFGALVATLGVPIIAIFVWQSLRKKVTEPRLGTVVFSGRRRRDLWHGLIAIFSLGLVVGGNLVVRIWFGRADSTFAQWFAPAIPATILAAMSLSCAIVLSLWRFAGYGLIFALAGECVAAAEMEPWWGMIMGGAAMAICGAVMLSRFLCHFPKLSNEVDA